MKKTDILNFFYLITIQAANAVLPLFVYPFVLLKIGSTLYAEVAIAESISVFITAFVLYGFDIDGVAMIVKHRDTINAVQLSDIFSNIFYARICILLLCLLPVILAMPFIPKQLMYLIFCWSLVPLGYILQCSYFYIGIEDNRAIALYNVVSRIVCVALVLLLVKSAGNIYTAPLIIGITFALGSLGATIYIVKKFHLKFTRISWQKILAALTTSKEIFFGNISIILYRDSNLLILGLLSVNPAIISAYSIANKLVNAFQAVVRPLNQLFFPKTIARLKNIKFPNKQSFWVIAKMTVYQLLILLALTCFLIIATIITNEYSNILRQYPSIHEIILYFFTMLAATFVGVSNFMFGSVGLNYLAMKKFYALAMIITGILTVTNGFILAKYFGGMGASVNFVCGELLLFLLILAKYAPWKDRKSI